MQFQQVHLIFWDLGGQAGLRSIWDKYYAESNALIYLIDASACSHTFVRCLLFHAFDLLSMHSAVHLVALWCVSASTTALACF